MALTLLLQIIQLAASFAALQTSGETQKDLALTQILFQIAAKALQAYQAQTGKPLDPSLIRAETPI